MRAAEARLRAQMEAVQGNGHANHTGSPGELEAVQSREASAQLQLAGLREANMKLQVEVGGLQRQLQQLQDECASAKVHTPCRHTHVF